MAQLNPPSRRADLVVEENGDELLVYDQRSDVAHRLNATAAIVWRHCDGRHSVSDLAEELRASPVGELADEDLVMVSLDGLAEAGLLDEAPERTSEEARLSRPRFIRRVGVVGSAALVLPVVHSIVAPTPASAQSGAQPTSCITYCCR